MQELAAQVRGCFRKLAGDLRHQPGFVLPADERSQQPRS
jgi:hypothetical protein